MSFKLSLAPSLLFALYSRPYSDPLALPLSPTGAEMLTVEYSKRLAVLYGCRYNPFMRPTVPHPMLILFDTHNSPYWKMIWWSIEADEGS